jgi:hypothetical protein
MIGIRAAASAAVAIIGLAALVGPREADPGAAIAAERLVRERAEAAVVAIDDLREAIEPGLDAARSGAAGVLTEEADPGPRLREAGDLIAAAEAEAPRVLRAVAALDGARRAWRPALEPIAAPIVAGELVSIGSQVADSAPAADAFADRRRRALAIPATLEEAIAALEAGDLDAATTLVTRARADHDLVAGWESPPPTLPVWIETSDAMVSAVEKLVAATRTGDVGAAREAADAFAARSDDGETADRALRIALSEGASALMAGPLERLAAVLGELDASRAAIAGLAAANR